jgi:hypothetical protein
MTCLDRGLNLPALRLVVAAFVIAPSAAALAADCAQWNVGGTHRLFQSNMGSANVPTGPQMTLQQDGAQFKGSMQYRYVDTDESVMLTRTGDIVGTVVGSKFEATVYWDNSQVGVYSGQIAPQGLLVGRTFDKNRYATNADFHATPAFDCLSKAAPNTGANDGTNDSAAKPPVALGRVQPLGLRIFEPHAGGTYPPQTPLRVRLVPAKDARDTAYRIEIQRQTISGSSSSSWNVEWREVIAVDTTAAVAQSPQGYREWGGAQAAGPRAAMTATGGLYRIRARATAPQAGQPGDWVEFRITGPRGTQDEAINQAKPGTQGAGGGAAQSAASRTTGQPGTPNALSSAPGATMQNKAQAVTLNPQPLPPKTTPGAPMLNAQTLLPKALGAAAALNPQPLPPAGLQQAPSSLR